MSVRAIFRIVLTAAVLTAPIGSAAADDATTTRPPAEFLSFLDRVDAAQVELQNGKAESFKALWSRSEEVTLAGGFGGTIEKGWERIAARLDWVAGQYSNGRTRRERVVVGVGGDLAYVVQHEHIEFRVPGHEADSTRDYRVTMVFRRESDGWKLVHRQADVQTQKQAPR